MRLVDYLKLILVLGCNAGNSYSCKNNGKCNETGYCECTTEYKGEFCQESKLYGMNVYLYYQYDYNQ